jgi:hypothetical protein
VIILMLGIELFMGGPVFCIERPVLRTVRSP